MIRSLLLSFVFVLVGGFTAAPLGPRIVDALRDASALPSAADIRLVSMPQVRGAVETVEITNFNPRSGRFDAVIGHGQNRMAIKGRAAVTVPVVVASAALRRNHLITASDVELRQLPLSQVPAASFSTLADLEGSAARRSLPAGRPIRDEDVGRPHVLQKNAAITIVYQSGGLSFQHADGPLKAAPWVTLSVFWPMALMIS
ncbi:MAG: flagellar basal body P-ring formation chaperone FlgA [Pseudomonadota bacterium]